MKTSSINRDTVDAVRTRLEEVENSFHADGSARTGLRAGKHGNCRGRSWKCNTVVALYGVIMETSLT